MAARDLGLLFDRSRHTVGSRAVEVSLRVGDAKQIEVAASMFLDPHLFRRWLDAPYPDAALQLLAGKDPARLGRQDGDGLAEARTAGNVDEDAFPHRKLSQDRILRLFGRYRNP